MSDRESRLIDLAAACSDGSAIDWDAAESSAATDSERLQVRDLRFVRSLAESPAAESWPAAASRDANESILNLSASGEPGSDAAPLTWGPLRVIERIGRGRFGDVYRAYDPRLDREVALKLLRHRDSSGDVVESQTIEEGRLLAKIHHPNVVTVYGAERIGGRVGLWMELVRGRTLEEELTVRGPLPLDEVAVIGREVCLALSAVHRAGLVHRDIKAQNVMRDMDGRLVLMDFGTGRELEAASPVELAGTPLYLAPEILNGEVSTPQSDIYSVGVLLHHLATGTFSVVGRTLSEIRRAHGAERPSRQTRTDGRTSPFWAVVERALNRDPRVRFSIAAEFAAALPAPVPESPVAASRWRGPGPLRAGVAVVALIVVGAAAFGAWRFRSSERRGAALPQATRQVWSGPGVDIAGSLSPDGRYLTFTDWSTGDLSVRDLMAGTDRRLTSTGGWALSGEYAGHAVVSADDEWVAVSWFTEDEPAWELRVLPMTATNGSVKPRTLMHAVVNDFFIPVAFTPDGSTVLVAQRKPDHTYEIFSVSASDGTRRRIVSINRGPDNGSVSLSPDGRFIAYHAAAEPGATSKDLFILDAATGAAIDSVSGPTNDSSPIWSPDGARLIFLSDRTGTPALWSVGVDRGRTVGTPTLLKADLGPAHLVGVTPAGALYYGVSGRARQNVYTAELNGSRLSEPKVLDPFVNANIGPAWSRDGARLAYYSLRPAPTLVVRSWRTGEERTLPVPATVDMPFYEGPQWFPDNDSLLIMTREARNEVRFQRLRVSTGQLEVVWHPPESNLSSYALAPDGRSIYYVHQHAGGTSSLANGRLMRYDLVTGREITLASGHWFITLAVSPDGHELAYVESIHPVNKADTTTVIRVIPSSGGEPRELFHDPNWYSGHRYNTLGWTADGAWVLFVGEDGGLRRVPARGGGAAESLNLTLKPRIKTPVVSQDGKHLAFGTVDADTNELWRLENFLPATAVAASASPSVPETRTAVSLERVWSGFEADLGARPSPDGRSVAYTHWASGGNLAIHDLATGANRLLTHDANYHADATAASPVFSPDGRSIAYQWDQGQNSSIRVIGIDGSSGRTVFERIGVFATPSAWSSDGRVLGLSLDETATHRQTLGLLGLNAGQFMPLTQLGYLQGDIGGISPDGRWLVYSVDSAVNRDNGIFVVATGGGRPAALVQSAAHDSSPRWTPDGHAVVFKSDRSGKSDLWMLPVSDGRPAGEPFVLRRGLDDAGLMGFTPDGSLFYGSSNGQSDPYVVTIDPVTRVVTGQPRRLSDDHQGSNHVPVWSPDGTRIAYLRGPRDSSQLVIRSADGRERTLSTAIQDGWSGSRQGVSWFPDGRSILLQDWVNDRKPFRKIDVATGATTTVFDASVDTWFAARVSPNGRDLYYSDWDHAHAVKERSTLRLYRRELATGRTVTLYETQSDGIGAFGLCVTPDGSTLAFSVNAEPGVRQLMTVPTSGGTPRVVFRGTYQNPMPSGLAWTRDGKEILFTAIASVDTAPRTEGLWSIPAAGGSPRRLDLTMPSLTSLSLSPDGTQLGFQSSRSYPEIWVIHNLLAGRPADRGNGR